MFEIKKYPSWHLHQERHLLPYCMDDHKALVDTHFDTHIMVKSRKKQQKPGHKKQTKTASNNQKWLSDAAFHWPARRDSNPRPSESESNINSHCTAVFNPHDTHTDTHVLSSVLQIFIQLTDVFPFMRLIEMRINFQSGFYIPVSELIFCRQHIYS